MCKVRAAHRHAAPSAAGGLWTKNRAFWSFQEHNPGTGAHPSPPLEAKRLGRRGEGVQTNRRLRGALVTSVTAVAVIAAQTSS